MLCGHHAQFCWKPGSEGPRTGLEGTREAPHAHVLRLAQRSCLQLVLLLLHLHAAQVARCARHADCLLAPRACAMRHAGGVGCLPGMHGLHAHASVTAPVPSRPARTRECRLFWDGMRALLSRALVSAATAARSSSSSSAADDRGDRPSTCGAQGASQSAQGASSQASPCRAAKQETKARGPAEYGQGAGPSAVLVDLVGHGQPEGTGPPPAVCSTEHSQLIGDHLLEGGSRKLSVCRAAQLAHTAALCPPRLLHPHESPRGAAQWGAAQTMCSAWPVLGGHLPCLSTASHCCWRAMGRAAGLPAVSGGPSSVLS